LAKQGVYSKCFYIFNYKLDPSVHYKYSIAGRP